jgi:hypothetical protein
LKQSYNKKRQTPENIHDKVRKQRKIDSQSDSDSEDHEEVSDHKVQVSEEVISTERVSTLIGFPNQMLSYLLFSCLPNIILPLT